MVQVITPANILLGAGSPYYRALASVAAWTGVGATSDDTTMRIAQSWFRPDLNGMLGPIQELDYLTEQAAELEFTMNEIAGSKLALAIPGATATAGATTDAGGTPFSSTLAAAAAIGATNIKVTAITNLAAGDYIQINVDGALAEYRQIDVVGTAGSGGTGVDFRDPLQKAHLSGVAAVETIGDGKTVITGSTVRRMAAANYNQWALVAEAPSGYYELLLVSGISATDSAEITTGDETMGGIRTTISARYAGATPNTPPWSLRVPA